MSRAICPDALFQLHPKAIADRSKLGRAARELHHLEALLPHFERHDRHITLTVVGIRHRHETFDRVRQIFERRGNDGRTSEGKLVIVKSSFHVDGVDRDRRGLLHLRDPGAWPRPRVFYPELHAARLVERARLEENFPTEGRDDPRAGAFLALRRVRPGGLQRARHRVVGAAPRGQAAARAAQITESDRVRGCLGWSCRQQNPKVPRQPGSHRAVNAA